MKYLSCAVLLLVSGIMLQQAIAAPQEIQTQEDKKYQREQSTASSEDRRSHDREQYRQEGDKRRHREGYWKTGTTLPEQYRNLDDQVDYTEHPNLTQPTRYQQWIKVKNKYILLNVITNTIIKVVPE